MKDDRTLVIYFSYDKNCKAKIDQIAERRNDNRIIERSQRHIMLDNGTVFQTISNKDKLRGYHADVLIVDKHVPNEVFNNIMVPAAAHGVLIDNR